MNPILKTLGFSSFFEQQYEPFRKQGFETGRIAIENKNNYTILSGKGILQGELSGKFLYTSDSAVNLPKVGDWVIMSVFEEEKKAVILDVLSRTTIFSRKVAGKKAEEQIIATNVDRVFIVQSLDHNYNLRRLERYLVMVHESGAKPVIVLNKTDMCADGEVKIAGAQQVAQNVPVIAISCLHDSGLEALEPFMEPGITIAFTGSSGVGKSTIINKLVGQDIQATGEVRATDAKGKHTTTRRELIVLPNGSILIDTPGMREMQLWHTDDGLDDAFTDIIRIISQCKFSDCTHTSEPKCAIIQALKEGKISAERYNSYLKLQKELAYLSSRQGNLHLLEKKQMFKKMQKQYKQLIRRKE